MTAGQDGFTAQEIVDRANDLGLTEKDNGPWAPPMRKSAGATIRNSRWLVNIGASRYAHMAFPGTALPVADQLQNLFRHCRSENKLACVFEESLLW